MKFTGYCIIASLVPTILTSQESERASFAVVTGKTR